MASVPWPPNLALSMQFMQSPDMGSVKIRGGTVGRGRTLQASNRNQDGGWVLRQRTAICGDAGGAHATRSPSLAFGIVWHQYVAS
jgi:hypothetical protein